jgi:hypothetical protein
MICSRISWWDMQGMFAILEVTRDKYTSASYDQNTACSLHHMMSRPSPQSSAGVSGLGIRLSIYLQAMLIQSILILSMFPTFSATKLDEPAELDLLLETTINMLVTAFALLVAAVIQAMSHRLSEYHALIVLKLNWVNSFNAVASIIVISPPSATHQPQLPLPPPPRYPPPKTSPFPNQRQRCPFASQVFPLFTHQLPHGNKTHRSRFLQPVQKTWQRRVQWSGYHWAQQAWNRVACTSLTALAGRGRRGARGCVGHVVYTWMKDSMDVRVLSSISESEEEDDICVAPSEMRAVPTKIKVKDIEQGCWCV